MPTTPRPATRAAADRVPLAQAQARRALALSAVFIAAAAVTAVVPHDTGRWLGLHLLLAGGAVAAISGSTVLFTVTWAAAPAPGRRLLLAQRCCIAAGVVGITTARELEAPSAVLVGSAVVFASGLALLAVVLARTVRRGVERRFDVAVAWYVTALGAGVLAAGLGALVGTGHGDGGMRAAHVTLNLLGLVGLVIAGTLPTFAPTMARTRRSRRATAERHGGLLAWQAAALALAATGLAVDLRWAATAGLAAYDTGLLVLLTILPRPRRRDVAWAGPRLLALWAGLGWWVAAVTATAVGTGRGAATFTDRWLLVLAFAAYGQIVWASFAYLGPVLRGGGHARLTQGFGVTRSWVGLLAVNIAGLAITVGATTLAAAAIAAWFLDAVARALRFRLPADGSAQRVSWVRSRR